MRTYILLDRSASMHTNWPETISAVNTYAAEFAKANEIKQKRITFAVFDSTTPFKLVRENIKAAKWTDVDVKEVFPRGMTPLFDAISKLYAKVMDDRPTRAAIVIVTDGAENASQEASKTTARSMIDTLKEKGYDVVFIGANFDAFAEASSVGIADTHTLNTVPASYSRTMANLARRSVTYGLTGQSVDFADEDRAAAMGQGEGGNNEQA